MGIYFNFSFVPQRKFDSALSTWSFVLAEYTFGIATNVQNRGIQGALEKIMKDINKISESEREGRFSTGMRFTRLKESLY